MGETVVGAPLAAPASTTTFNNNEGKTMLPSTIRHKIYCRHQGVGQTGRLPVALIKKCVRAALDAEGVDAPCEVSVLITGDEVIREINCQYRGKDEPTDVISFPMLEFSSAGWTNAYHEISDPETGLLPLGEIVMSAPRVDKQAREYGHPREHEAAYLTIHSVLHLLGYDHIDEAELKKQMRKREKEIIKEIQKEIGF